MKALRFLRALPLVSLLLASPVLASQATIVGPVVGPHTMADVMGTVNAAFLAIQGCNSGTSAPVNGPSAAPVSFQMWCDTTTNPVVVKMYDGASWVVVGKLNTSSHIWTPEYQGTDLGTASTANTGTSAHVLGFLDGANTYSATQSGATAAVDTNTTQFATTAFVLGQAASATPLIDGSAAVGTSTRFARGDHVHPTDTTRAALASPALTGTPTAPTAAVDTNTTQLATTAYVIGQAASATPLIDGSAAVGTSTRYARADHVHPTDTTRAPLASPALTGTPTAPTASPATNSTQLATTAYADAIAGLKANTANAVLTGLVDLQGAFKLSGVASSSITSSQNDFNPSSAICSSISTLRMSTNASLNVTGFAGGVTGCRLTVMNVGANPLVLTDSDAASSAVNRLLLGGSATIAVNNSYDLQYDGTSQRWRAVVSPGSGGGGGSGISSLACGDVGINCSSNPVTTTGTIKANFARSFLLGGM